MTQDLTPKTETPADSTDTAVSAEDVVNKAEVSLCQCGRQEAIYSCTRCQAALCDACSYHEGNGTSFYCRDCANEIVGVCDVCDVLHARPCHECRKMVCEQHHKRVIERWGWGGAPGQGGFTNWFPVVRTYCQEHGKNRFDMPKPNLKTFKGYDGSSPEW